MCGLERCKGKARLPFLPSHKWPLRRVSLLAGEAFDKAARLLGLELRPNGGTALENLAREGDPQRFQFSMPLKKYKDCNFSFAGTKTAVRLAIEDQLPEGPTPANRQAGFLGGESCFARWP